MLYLILLLFPALFNAFQKDRHTLTVQVNGANQKGYLMAELRNQKNEVVKQVKQNIKTEGTTLTFANLAGMRYAVAVFHDENADEKLNTNLVGMPKERYGFSNNARGTIGPPPLTEQLVEVTNNRSITIQVK